MQRNYLESSLRGILMGALTILMITGAAAQTPTFEIGTAVEVNQLSIDEINLAVNTSEAEILVVVIDTSPDGALLDPINGTGPLTQAVMGTFLNPTTLAAVGAPFLILGNPSGNFETLDAQYNPVTNQYVVVSKANTFTPENEDVPLLALVNPASVAAGGNPVALAILIGDEANVRWDDVSVAVSTANGNIIMVGERNYPDASGSEGVAGILLDPNGLVLSDPARFDPFMPSDGDEDDPDVAYLPNANLFISLTNTDTSVGPNTLSATVFETSVSGDVIVQGIEQSVGAMRLNGSMGHASVIENPFNSEILGAFNIESGGSGGDIFYMGVGAAPDYALVEVRTQVQFAIDNGNSTLHPQMAVNPNRGYFVVTHPNGPDTFGNASRLAGMYFTLLGLDGEILPGRPGDEPVLLVETSSEPGGGANSHAVKYDPTSDSFIVAYSVGGAASAISLKVTSDLLGGTPTPTPTPIPAVSAWGLIVMALILFAGGALLLRNRPTRIRVRLED